VSRFFKEDEVGLGRAFEISTVNRHDAGTYTCLATNSLGESMAKDVAIDVQFPPNVTASSSAARPVVEGRDSVTLACAADANPEAELAWRKEGEGRVLGNFPTLDIGVVSRTDMGTYTCTATNPLGVSQPATVDVITYFPPNVTVVSSSAAALVEGADSVILTCTADSNPPPTYLWVRKGGPQGEVGRGPVLTISPVDRTDIDTYSCIASNSLGSSQPRAVSVDVHFLPNVTITAAATVLVEGRDGLKLDCEVDSNPKPSIAW